MIIGKNSGAEITKVQIWPFGRHSYHSISSRASDEN